MNDKERERSMAMWAFFFVGCLCAIGGSLPGTIMFSAALLATALERPLK